MLYCNKKMNKYLKLYSKKYIDLRNCHYQTNLTEMRKTILDGDEYCIYLNDHFFCFEEREIYRIDNNWLMSDLSEYEWEGNEWYITSEVFRHKAMMKAIHFVISLKRELQQKYKDRKFTIVLIGGMSSNPFEESAQVRFYMNRPGCFEFPIEKIPGSNHQPMLAWKSN